MKNEELKKNEIALPLVESLWSRRQANPQIFNVPSSIFIYLIRFYQVSLGRFLGGQCRFVPTCSQYAIEAVREFGALKGGYMAAKRIAKCHPFG
jgi:hypothetical protein